MMCYCFFFFKQKTAYEMRISDWSSDVCSSDLEADREGVGLHAEPASDEIVAQLVDEDERPDDEQEAQYRHQETGIRRVQMANFPTRFWARRRDRKSVV